MKDLNDSVASLLVEKDKFKKLWQDSREVLGGINSRMVCIGGPLNDNILQFNKKQLHYCNLAVGQAISKAEGR